jgi:CheY-like chemotaxis protein/two-component sensor histidine kinase
VTQLTRLVDDLLDVSRISLGKIKLRTETLELAPIVQEAVETSRPLIDGHHHSLLVIVPDKPIRLRGDRARLTQVIANLLNNAAKYQNDGGSIELRIEPDQDQVTITVRDEGVGIQPDFIPAIFELFAQGERSPDRARDGLGIGLSLVRTVVGLHHGTVTATSAGLGTGSTFTVRLPVLRFAGDPGSDGSGQPAAHPECPPLRVLVLDDNRDAADSLSWLLQLNGHTVLQAREGEEALRLAVQEKPSVVLLDIGLPGLDGYEICRRMRQNGLSDALIVAMTGYGLERDRVRSRDAGFDAHLVKPVPPSEVLQLMMSHAGPARIVA